MAKSHLRDMEKGGVSGEWRFSISDKGNQTRKTQMDGLKDLDDFLTKHDIPRPVILTYDGHLSHYSLGKIFMNS